MVELSRFLDELGVLTVRLRLPVTMDPGGKPRVPAMRVVLDGLTIPIVKFWGKELRFWRHGEGQN